MKKQESKKWAKSLMLLASILAFGLSITVPVSGQEAETTEAELTPLEEAQVALEVAKEALETAKALPDGTAEEKEDKVSAVEAAEFDVALAEVSLAQAKLGEAKTPLDKAKANQKLSKAMADAIDKAKTDEQRETLAMTFINGLPPALWTAPHTFWPYGNFPLLTQGTSVGMGILNNGTPAGIEINPGASGMYLGQWGGLVLIAHQTSRGAPISIKGPRIPMGWMGLQEDGSWGLPSPVIGKSDSAGAYGYWPTGSNQVGVFFAFFPDVQEAWYAWLNKANATTSKKPVKKTDNEALKAARAKALAEKKAKDAAKKDKLKGEEPKPEGLKNEEKKPIDPKQNPNGTSRRGLNSGRTIVGQRTQR